MNNASATLVTNEQNLINRINHTHEGSLHTIEHVPAGQSTSDTTNRIRQFSIAMTKVGAKNIKINSSQKEGTMAFVCNFDPKQKQLLGDTIMQIAREYASKS